MKYSKRLILVSGTLFINYFLDRLTKILAANYLQGKGSVNIFGDFVILRYIENNGAFLSMGSGWGHAFKLFVFIILPVLVCIFGILYCLFKDIGKFESVFIVTIAAGGIGNIQDRIFNNGYVIDFLNFGIGNLRTGILNIADISVTFGVILFAIYEIFKSIKEKSYV